MVHHKYPDCYPLIVDDDRDYRLLLKKVLERVGVPRSHIRMCADGDEAMSLLSIDAKIPSFVLLDVHMPGRTGLEVLEWIRAAPPPLDRVSIFMLTSDPNPDYVARAFRAGIGSYFMKPLDVHALEGILEGIVAHWKRRHPADLLQGHRGPVAGGE